MSKINAICICGQGRNIIPPDVVIEGGAISGAALPGPCPRCGTLTPPALLNPPDITKFRPPEPPRRDKALKWVHRCFAEAVAAGEREAARRGRRGP